MLKDETKVRSARTGRFIRTGRGLILVFLGMVMLILVGKASAQQTPPSDDEVNAVAKGLYCPVCENIPLDVCPTQACIQWRDLIRQQLAEGKTEAEIKDYFVQQYGDRVLAAPPARGFNWLAYVIPPVAILIGAFILYQALRSLVRTSPATPEASLPTIDGDEYVRRLEEELSKR